MQHIQIKIFEVRSPSLFYGREVTNNADSSSERILFHELQQNLNAQFNNPQSCGLFHQPSKNEVCIGKSSNQQWYRVRVEDVYRRQKGHDAKCFLLDFGTMEMIPFQCLRRATQSHLSVPYQVKSYSLYGIQAQTMALQEDLSCHMEPCISWDESATEYMKKCIQKTPVCFADVKKADANITEVVLYLVIENVTICFNEELLRKNYAVKKIPEGLQGAVTSHKTRSQPLKMEEELKKLQLRKSKLEFKTTPTSSDIETASVFSETHMRKHSPRTDSEAESTKSDSVSNNHIRKAGLGRGFSLGQTLREWKGRSKTEITKDTESFVKKDVNNSSKMATGKNNSAFSHSTPTDYQDSHMLSFVHRHQKPKSGSEEQLPMFIGKRQGSSGDSALSTPSNKSIGSPVNGMLGRLMNSLIVHPPTSSHPSVSDSELLKSSPLSASHPSVHTEGYSSESVQKNIRTFTPSSLQKCQASVAKSSSINTSPESMHSNKTLELPKRMIVKSEIHEKSSSHCEEFNENLQGATSSFDNTLDTKQPEMKDLVAESLDSFMQRRSDMMGRMQGNRILENLSGGAKSKSTSTAIMSRKISDSVLVHSLKKISPYVDFDSVPFVPELNEILKGFEFPSPMLIQAYGWPYIMKLKHMVGISPVNTGKTFTYLCPLLNELLQLLSYKELAIGNGPLALILVSSWRKAQSVFDITRGLLRDHKRPRPLVIYGGGCEQNQYVPLMNGCEILIATPPCLVRMINRRYTDLQRLCHLVVSDADLVLKEYSEEVQKIMEWFAEARKENIHKSVPYQIITMGTQWTPVVNNFTKAYMPDPSIVITSRFEAAIYGKVIQQVQMCQSSQRSKRLLELLDTILTNGIKVIIFTTTVNDVCFLLRLLKSHSLCCDKVHHQMESYEIESVIHDWKSGSEKDSPKLLVCTDECIDEMKIDNANAVIHFDLPSESKTRFGNRLSCMKKYYAQYSESEEEEVVQLVKPVSYILMTEESTGQARSVRDLLKRLKISVPKQLTALLAGMKQQQEEDKEKGLCSYVKAYGTCRYQTRCSYRHIILSDVDKPCFDLLMSGEVKIRVANVVNATCYYARVLEHRSTDGTQTDLSITALSISFEMGKWFSNKANHVRLGNVCVGDVCAIEEDTIFYRVQIQDFKGSNSPSSKTMQAQVFFVDEGRVKDVSMFKLYQLAPHLKTYAFQTVEVYLCRLRPIDRDEHWTTNADQYVHSLLKDKVLDGRIVLSIGNTLWLDPIVERQHLKQTQTTINKMYVRSELLRNGFAVNNEQHVQNLYNLCEGLLPFPSLQNAEDSADLSVETDLLPESEEFHKVFVSACDDPGLIFLQRCQFVKQMDVMVDAINDKLQKTEITPMKASCCKVGTVCLGKYTQDDTWYRVKILQCEEGGDYKVIFCDQGDTEVLPLNRLHPFPQEYSEIPMLAIECELAHVQPRGENWDESVGDALWDMTHTVAGGNKNLMAKVIGRKDSVFTGVHRYVVELWDTYTANDINLAQELVWSGLVSPKAGSNLQEMFPRPPMINFQVYKNPVQIIMDLCACLYWRSSQKRRIPPAFEIFDLVTKSVKSNPLDLVGYRGIAAIIKLIGRLTDDTAHNCLLESLLVAAEASDRLAEEIVNQDGDHSVIQCLDQKSRPKIQMQAVEAIYRLIKCNNRFVKTFSDASVLEVLCEILEVAEEPEILSGTGKALNIICKKSKSASDIVYHFKVCELITESLKRTSDLQASQSLLEFLVTLVDKNGKQEGLHNERLAKVVVSKMDSFITSDVCIAYGVRYCENLCQENRKKKTFLLEQGVAVILRKAFKLQKLSVTTYGKCEDLINSLAVRVATSDTINNRPINANWSHNPQQRSVPTITWAQNKRNVILAVKVARAGDVPVRVGQNSFEFRTVVDDTLYEAKHELYGRIQPNSCHVSVKRSEVLVKLRKEELGSWPRLLKQKTKLPNISLDYDKFACSSSEEDISDDNNPFILKKRKIKKFPKDMKRPKGLAVGGCNYESEEDTEEDSSEEADFGLKRSTLADDYDPYDIFGMAS